MFQKLKYVLERFLVPQRLALGLRRDVQLCSAPGAQGSMACPPSTRDNQLSGPICPPRVPGALVPALDTIPAHHLNPLLRVQNPGF